MSSEKSPEKSLAPAPGRKHNADEDDSSKDPDFVVSRYTKKIKTIERAVQGGIQALEQLGEAYLATLQKLNAACDEKVKYVIEFNGSSIEVLENGQLVPQLNVVTFYQPSVMPIGQTNTECERVSVTNKALQILQAESGAVPVYRPHACPGPNAMGKEPHLPILFPGGWAEHVKEKDRQTCELSTMLMGDPSEVNGERNFSVVIKGMSRNGTPSIDLVMPPLPAAGAAGEAATGASEHPLTKESLSTFLVFVTQYAPVEDGRWVSCRVDKMTAAAPGGKTPIGTFIDGISPLFNELKQVKMDNNLKSQARAPLSTEPALLEQVAARGVANPGNNLQVKIHITVQKIGGTVTLSPSNKMDGTYVLLRPGQISTVGKTRVLTGKEQVVVYTATSATHRVLSIPPSGLTMCGHAFNHVVVNNLVVFQRIGKDFQCMKEEDVMALLKEIDFDNYVKSRINYVKELNNKHQLEMRASTVAANTVRQSKHLAMLVPIDAPRMLTTVAIVDKTLERMVNVVVEGFENGQDPSKHEPFTAFKTFSPLLGDHTEAWQACVRFAGSAEPTKHVAKDLWPHLLCVLLIQKGADGQSSFSDVVKMAGDIKSDSVVTLGEAVVEMFKDPSKHEEQDHDDVMNVSVDWGKYRTGADPSKVLKDFQKCVLERWVVRLGEEHFAQLTTFAAQTLFNNTPFFSMYSMLETPEEFRKVVDKIIPVPAA